MPSIDLDSLNDELVSELVAHMGYREWRVFASTCRRLCHLVRARHVRALQLWSPSQAPLLLRVPSSRAFLHIIKLRLEARIATLEDQAQLARAMWLVADALPQLQEVQLATEADVHTDARAWLSLEGPILALQSVTSLRSLAIDGDPDQRSLLYFVPGLTQLTSLRFASQLYGNHPPQLNPHYGLEPPALRRLTNVVDLDLEGVEVCGGEHPLPPALTSLQVVSPRGDLEDWWDQVARCEQLQVLVVGSQSILPEGHPSLLLKRIAGSLTALTKLIICGEEEGDNLGDVDPIWLLDPADRLQRLLRVIEDAPAPAGAAAAAAPAAPAGPQLLEAAGQQQQQELLVQVPRAPLGKDQGWAQPAGYTVVPPPNLGRLSCLVRLEVAAWWLVVSTDRHWRALAACTALQSLLGLHTCAAPPAGVSFPGVTQLEVVTGTSPGDTLGVLGAFPGLGELRLVLVPHEGSSSSSSSSSSSDANGHGSGTGINSASAAGGTGCISRMQGNPEAAAVLLPVTHARIAVVQGPGAQQLEPYFSKLFAAMPSLQRLELGAHDDVELLPQLPSLSALRSLACLKYGYTTSYWSWDPVGKFHVPALLLQAVRKAPQLRQVEVQRPGPAYYVGEPRDRLVLGLQEALPGLRVLKLSCRSPSGVSWGTPFPVELGAATRAALRPGLVVTNLW